MNAAELYETDFVEWAERNAELLRSGRVAEADLENIAEEIEALARSDRRALRRRLARLMQHLLKWQFQPEKRGQSWTRTIVEQRLTVEQLLEDSPSLRTGLDDLVENAYSDAIRFAASETRHTAKKFPAQCPYTLDQLLDYDFLPPPSAAAQ